jgi:cell division septation protein DedD
VRTNRITAEIVTAAAAGLDLVAPRAPVFGWLKRHAAAFAAGAAVTAVVTVAGAYGVSALQARASSGRANALAAQSQVPADLKTASSEATGTPAAQGTTGPSTPAPVDSQPRPGESEVVASGAAAQPGARKYSVLVGSFRYEPEAASLLEQLRGLGYRVRTSRVNSTGRGTWHQVFVGPYGDLGRARQDEARVRQLPGYADARLVTQ